jgi:Tol biopolymer transport system component
MIFAEGSTTFSMPHLGVISANIKELKKENATQIAGGTFTVEITNVNSTRPKILSVVCQNVIVQQDTALNFQVQEAISAYSLCYERQDTISYNNRNDYLAWAIHLNNNTGTNPKTIMNWPWNNEYPSWSPDGKYIAIMHENSDGVNLYLYDTAVDTLRQLTTSGRINSGTPIWTTDNKKIVYGYIGPQNNETHIIDVDGSGDRKLKINPTGWCVSYIYPDNYTCLYSSGTKLYKSNLDSSFSEFVLDEISTTIRDFNPLTGELLVNTNVTPDSSEVIAEYNVETKQLNVLLAADKGFMISMQRYSKDYSKIVFDEMNTNGYTEEYLSILENGVKRRLVRLFGGQAGGESLDFNPMQFSPDGKYVAFSKNVDQEGPWVWFKSYLFIVDITTGELQYIDMGFNPMWNPKISH